MRTDRLELTKSLDNTNVKSNKSLPMAKILTIPEAWSHRRDFSQKLKNLYAYATAVMEAWDGPAAICGAHDDWAIAGMDRNGLRPIRYTLTSDYFCLLYTSDAADE